MAIARSPCLQLLAMPIAIDDHSLRQSSTSLPRTWSCSPRSCASAACSRRNTRSPTGVTRPLSTQCASATSVCASGCTSMHLQGILMHTASQTGVPASCEDATASSCLVSSRSMANVISSPATSPPKSCSSSGPNLCGLPCNAD